MSIVQTWATDSTNLDSTLELAAAIGRKLCGGETIELIGDLGSGKTAFVRGLARGMGSPDQVHSPSFTISNQYQCEDGRSLHHFDFHRLSEPGLLSHELAEILTDPQAVIAVEWATIVEDVLPAERLTIDIRATDPNKRRFTFSYPAQLSYILAHVAPPNALSKHTS